MADLGPAIVTVVGTLGGGIVGALGTLLVTRSSNNAAATRSINELTHQAGESAKEIQHREKESELARQHDLTLEEQRTLRTARLALYPDVVKVLHGYMIHYTYNVDRFSEGLLPEPEIDWPRRAALPDVAAGIDVVASDSTVEAFHKWLRSFTELRDMVDPHFTGGAQYPSSDDVDKMIAQRGSTEQLSLGLMSKLRDDLKAH